MVAWNKFSTLWLLSIGLSPSTTGLLKSLGLLAKTVSQPTWAAIADMELLGRLNPRWAELSSHWLLILTTAASILCLEIFRRFAAIMSLPTLIAARLTWSVINTASILVDVMVARLALKSKEGYGKQKLWGAVAWGGMSLVCGVMIDARGLDMMFTYTSAARFALIACILWAMQEEQLGGHEHVKKKHVMGMHEYVLALRRVVVEQPLLKFVYVANLYLGFIMVIPEHVLSMQIERDFRMSRTMNSLTTALSLVAAVPCFWYSERLVLAWGHFAMIISSHLLAAMMLLLNAFMTTPSAPLILLISALKGAAYALSWTASVDFTQHLVHADLVSTCQTLVHWIYYTIAGGLGFLVWSWTYQVYGAGVTSQMGTLATLLEIVILRTALARWRAASSGRDKELSDKEQGGQHYVAESLPASGARRVVSALTSFFTPVGPLRSAQPSGREADPTTHGA